MDDAPAITTVEQLLAHAVAHAASDIHIESTADGLRVRYRTDGLLYDQRGILSDYAAHVLARFKVLARLDIAEKRIPQDGKFTIEGPRGPIDVRIATFPGIHGEEIVVRLLDRAQQVNGLESIGLEPKMLEEIKAMMHRSQGFFVVTGPTGSGKTTTLYSILSSLCSSEKNIVTLEDPVEYTIPGTTQGQINPEIGFDFAKGIRAILRQDPDIIMVGEMRDNETAQTAIQAALTGHLVLSTLHTNDAPGAVIRLIDMNIKAFLINAAITGILAQRLVRVLCSACKYQAAPTPEEQQYLAKFNLSCEQAFHAKGCEACHKTGYRGRIGVFELLAFTPQVRAAIHDDLKYDELHAAARAQGMQPLLVDAMQKVAAGVTSIQELMRVIV